MPERDAEQGDDRRADDRDDHREHDRLIGRPEDERAITLSGLLGETPEEASRRPLPPSPELTASPRRSLLLVGFSAVVVACLVALGALINHSGGFPGVLSDHQTSGLSDGDAPARGAPGPEQATPGPATGPGPAPGVALGPGATQGSSPTRGSSPTPGSGPTPGSNFTPGSGPARGSASADSSGGSGAPGAALGTPASGGASSGAGSGHSARGDARHPDSGGSGGGSDHPASASRRDDGSGGVLLDTVDLDPVDLNTVDLNTVDLNTVESVLGGLTDSAGTGGLDVRLTDLWHDGSGHDHSGRRTNHPGLRAAPAGIAPGIRLSGR